MKKNACNNRPPLKTSVVVQDGWYMDGVTRCPRMVTIKDQMSKDCQYSKTTQDAGCDGCKWRADAANA